MQTFQVPKETKMKLKYIYYFWIEGNYLDSSLCRFYYVNIHTTARKICRSNVKYISINREHEKMLHI